MFRLTGLETLYCEGLDVHGWTLLYTAPERVKRDDLARMTPGCGNGPLEPRDARRIESGVARQGWSS